MNKYLFLLASAFILNMNFSFAQKDNKQEEKSRLIAGPMLSYIDNYHAQMWMLISKETKKVTIKLENFDEDISQKLVYDVTDPKSYNNSAWFDFYISDYNNGDEIPVILTLEELIPDTEYILFPLDIIDILKPWLILNLFENTLSVEYSFKGTSKLWGIPFLGRSELNCPTRQFKIKLYILSGLKKDFITY